jgi:hypothetical protein
MVGGDPPTQSQRRRFGFVNALFMHRLSGCLMEYTRAFRFSLLSGFIIGICLLNNMVLFVKLYFAGSEWPKIFSAVRQESTGYC